MKKFWMILITITLVLALCGTIFACGDNTDPNNGGGGEPPETSDTLPQFDGEKTDLGKDDVKEIAKNFDCGIMLQNYQDVKVGDIIEAFRMEKLDED